MTILVFAGPTLPVDQITRQIDATILPPAGQGDVWRAVLRHRPAVIGLIDGVFRGRRAVWHREILWALSQGVHVLGAASMGALRAAELHTFGMTGVGRVFQAYRDGLWPGDDGPFEDDDEVAVEHAPAELGHAPLSTAMVDLRDTLLAAEAAGALGRADRQRVCAGLKALHYPSRGLDSLDRLAGQPLSGFLVQTKRADALALLQILPGLAAAAPFQPAFRFQNTLIWQRFLAGQQAGAPPVDRQADLRRALTAFRTERGLTRREDLTRWMADHELDEAGLIRLLGMQDAPR